MAGWYKAAKWFSFAVLAFAVIPTYGILFEASQTPYDTIIYVDVPATPAEPVSALSLAVAISLVALLVAAVGTASSVILGWRNERRQAAEAKLEIEPTDPAQAPKM